MSDPNQERHVEDVRQFYGRNTDAFLRLGENGGTAAIHIALWPEGTETVEAAMNVANDLVISVAEDSPIQIQRVVDLGCGVGASLHYLSRHMPDQTCFEGITVCPEQAAWAEAHNPSGDRVRVLAGDYHEASSLLSPCQLAFAIEAFAHAADPGRVFSEVSKLLEPGGRLVLIDDLCTRDEPPSKALETYRQNWMVPSVQPLSSLDTLAAEAGLRRIETRDLTPWLRLGRPRDKWLRWSLPLWGWTACFWHYAKSMKGGDARQRCLEQGETMFSMVVYERMEMP